jgi:glycosyltransferase involved in cell wall biosynthesis
MTKQNLSITAFCPCYNDGGTIASMVILMVETLKKLTDDYEVIVVDDGSKDHSREILKNLEAAYDNLRVIYHEKNKGYGGALKTGFYSAKKDLIFYTDGDFQYDVAELEKLMAALSDGVDIVNGYKSKRSDPVHRKVIGRIYHHIVKILFGLKIRDVDCVFRLIRRAVFDRINLKYDSGVICVELVKKLQDAGFKFAEVPVTHFFRSYGKSQFFDFKRVFTVGINILRLWWEVVVKKRG